MSTGSFFNAIDEAKKLLEGHKDFSINVSTPARFEELQDKLEALLSTYYDLILEVEAINNEKSNKLSINRLNNFLSKMKEFEKAAHLVNKGFKAAFITEHTKTQQTQLEQLFTPVTGQLEKLHFFKDIIETLDLPTKMKLLEDEVNAFEKSEKPQQPAEGLSKQRWEYIKKRKEEVETGIREKIGEHEDKKNPFLFKLKLCNALVQHCPLLTLFPPLIGAMIYLSAKVGEQDKEVEKYQERLDNLGHIKKGIDSIEKSLEGQPEKNLTQVEPEVQQKIDTKISDLKKIVGSLAKDLNMDIAQKEKYSPSSRKF